MRSKAMLAALVLAAACGQGAEEAAAPPPAPAPADALGRINAMGRDIAAIGEYVRASAGPTCERVFRMEDRGAVPADVPIAAFQPYVGARVFSVHCGALGAPMTDDGSGQFAIVFPADAPAPVALPCVSGGANICWTPWRELPAR